MKYDVEANDSLTEIAARARSQQVVLLVILMRKGCTCSRTWHVSCLCGSGVCAAGCDTCRTCEEGMYVITASRGTCRTCEEAMHVHQVVVLVALVRKGCTYNRSWHLSYCTCEEDVGVYVQQAVALAVLVRNGCTCSRSWHV